MAQLEVRQNGFHRLIHAMRRASEITPIGSINHERKNDHSHAWRRLKEADLKGARLIGESYPDACSTIGRFLQVPPSEEFPLRVETLLQDGNRFVEYWAIVQYSSSVNTFRTIEITGFDPTPRRISMIKNDRYFVNTVDGELLLQPETIMVWEDEVLPCYHN